MTERKKQKALRQLEEIAVDAAVELRLRDPDSKKIDGHLYEIDSDSFRVYYGSRPSSPDVEYGSKVDPRDWLPFVSFSDLGYVFDKSTGRKISLMPFQKSS